MTSLKNLLLPFSLLLFFIVIFAGSIFFQFSKNPKIPIPQGLTPSSTPAPEKTAANFFNPAKTSLQKLSLITNDNGFWGTSISKDQKFIYLANPLENFIYLVDVQDGKISDKVPIPSPLAIIPFNQNLLVVQKNVLSFLSSNLQTVKTGPILFEATVSLLTADQKYLLLANVSSNNLTVFDAKTLQPITDVPLEQKPLVLFENNELIFVAYKNDWRVSIFSLDSLKIISTVALKFQPSKLIIDQVSGKILAIDTPSSSLWILGSPKDPMPKETKLNDAPTDFLQIEGSDFFLILGQHGSVFLFDAKEKKVVKTFTTQSSLLSKDLWAKILFISSPAPKVFLLSADGKKLQAYSLGPTK